MMYIGRTEAYYEGDDEAVFTPEMWTSSENPDDLAGDVHELTESGEGLLSQYYDDLSAGYDLCNGRAKGLADRYTREEMYELLTDSMNGYSISCEE